MSNRRFGLVDFIGAASGASGASVPTGVTRSFFCGGHSGGGGWLMFFAESRYLGMDPLADLNHLSAHQSADILQNCMRVAIRLKRIMAGKGSMQPIRQNLKGFTVTFYLT